MMKPFPTITPEVAHRLWFPVLMGRRGDTEVCLRLPSQVAVLAALRERAGLPEAFRLLGEDPHPRGKARHRECLRFGVTAGAWMLERALLPYDPDASLTSALQNQRVAGLLASVDLEARLSALDPATIGWSAALEPGDWFPGFDLYSRTQGLCLSRQALAVAYGHMTVDERASWLETYVNRFDRPTFHGDPVLKIDRDIATLPEQAAMAPKALRSLYLLRR